MAGDYLQIDNDLPEKPEVQRICDLTGVSLDTVVGRLVMFWRWVDRHASSQCVTGTSRTLARVAGGDEKFWEDVASLNEWLGLTSEGIVIHGWKKRFSKSAKNRIKNAERQSRHRVKKRNAFVTQARDKNVTGALPTEQNRTEEKISVLSSNKRSEPSKESIGDGTPRSADLVVSEEDLGRAEQQIASLFKRAGYSGKDGLLLWQLGILVQIGVVPESVAHSVCNGAGMNARRNPIGFVRRGLTEECAKLGIDLKRTLASMRFPRMLHKGPPKQRVGTMASLLGDSLARKE